MNSFSIRARFGETLSWGLALFFAGVTACYAEVPEAQIDPVPLRGIGSTRALPGVIAGSSLFLALLQSVCTFFAAMEGMRLALGISSRIVSASAAAVLDRLHADWIRVPMIVLALLGSLLNLVVLMQIWNLRNRPSSQWRQVTPSRQKLRREKVQFALSIATLIIIGIEEYLHFRWCHHL